MTSPTPDAPWLLSRGAAGGVRVFCFPHAGGNPRAYLEWQAGMDPHAEIVAVCTSGRSSRIDELADGAAAAIAARADRPIYLFGHSLGAMIAFEVARRLGDLPALRHLVASGCSAPSLLPSHRVVEAARLEGRAFAEAVEFFGGMPRAVLADEELRDLLLAGLQEDLRMAAQYRYQPGPPLALRVSLINGRDDPHVGEAALQSWEHECRDAPDYYWSDGGHFYLEQRPLAVINVLRKIVRADFGRDAHSKEHIEVI